MTSWNENEGRCAICKANKKVISIFFGIDGFLVTLECGHQIGYQAKLYYDDKKVEVKQELCREHHTNSGDRCSYCAIKPGYYAECMSMLNSWPKEDKETDEWKRKVDDLKCKPHTHEAEQK